MRSTIASFLLLVFSLPLSAAEPQGGGTPSDATEAAEWRPLFDGKTLENWKRTDFGGEGDVRVEDGSLVIDMGNPLTGVTWAGKRLPTVNYEVELEGRRRAGSDFFCALTFPINDTHASLVLGGWGGTVIGISSINGQDASENETTDFFQFEKDKWYKIRLRVTEEAITAWIGDKQIAEVDPRERNISTRIEVDPSKPFGIATYQTKGEIRNLRIRTLETGAEKKSSSK